MKLPVANPPLYALLNQHQAIASDIVSMREELAETQAGIDELTREGELVQKSLAVMLERVDPGHLNERAFHFTSRLRNVEWELIANPGFGRFYHHDLARMWEKRELEEFSAVARHLGLDDEYAGVLEVIRDCEYRIRKGAFYGTNDLANAKWQARKNFRNGWPIK